MESPGADEDRQMIEPINERWLQAHERMRSYVDAVLWQDLGVPSPDREHSVDWILDKIIKGEYLAVLHNN
jgi:hypothetical protein